MLSDKTASFLQNVFWIVIIGVIHFISFITMMGMLQGIVDSAKPEPVPWLLGFLYTVLAFPLFYLMPLFEAPLRQLLGDNAALLVMIGLNGLIWGVMVVGSVRGLAYLRRRKGGHPST